ALLAGLILPFACRHLALEIHLGALLQILFGDLAQAFIEDDDLVPFRALLALARGLVAPALRRGDGKGDDPGSRLRLAHFGIPAEAAEQSDLVDAHLASLRHGLLFLLDCR